MYASSLTSLFWAFIILLCLSGNNFKRRPIQAITKMFNEGVVDCLNIIFSEFQSVLTEFCGLIGG